MFRAFLPRLGTATLIAVATALVIPTVGGWQILRTRAALLAAVEQNNRTLSRSLAQHATRTVEAVGIVLDDVAERLGHPDGQDLDTFLQHRANQLAQARYLGVIDEKGNMIADTLPPHAPANMADRAYFVWHRDHDNTALHMGDLLISKVTKRPVIPITRRVNDQDGRFAGVVLAGLTPEDFQGFYKSLHVGPRSVVALWSDAGQLLARYPADPDASARGPAGPDNEGMPPEPVSSRVLVSHNDGVERITTLQHLDDLPLAVSAAVSVEEALRPWRHKAALESSVLGIASYVLLILAVLFERNRRSAARIEQQSHKADRLYRLLGENSSDLIVVHSKSSARIIHVSPSARRIVGWSPEELAAMPTGTYLHPEDLPGVEAQLSILSATNPTVTSLHRVRHKDGRYVWVEAVFQFTDEEAFGESIVFTARDVTERQRAAHDMERARAVAEHAAQQKSEFVANMSHELRTPLTGMLGVHDLMRSDPTLSPLQRRYLAMAQDSGRSLLAIVNDVLDFSKIEAGKLSIEAVPFDPAAVIEACRELAADEARKKGLRLEVVRVDGLRPLVGDPTRLRQVLLNLMTNAIKFTHEGRITVSARYFSDPALLHIEVADTGIGIPDHKLPLLFERFSQVDASTTRRYGGTGLGLAICKRLTELMGGAISVTSEPGCGSTFRLDLPLAVAPADGGTTDGAVEIVATSRKRILLAEDNHINQEIIVMMLRQHGHEVTVVDDGAAAVQAARAQPAFDLILMDLQMPVLDGLSATCAIRAEAQHEGRDVIHIVGLTANAMAEDVERCLAAGMVAHIAKPIDWPVLFEIVDRIQSTPAPTISDTRMAYAS